MGSETAFETAASVTQEKSAVGTVLSGDELPAAREHERRLGEPDTALPGLIAGEIEGRWPSEVRVVGEGELSCPEHDLPDVARVRASIAVVRAPEQPLTAADQDVAIREA